MRIVRYASPDAAGGRGSAARLGRVRGDEVEPLHPGDRFPELADLIEHGVFGRLLPARLGSSSEPLARVRLLAPLAAPGKVVAIGLNYLDHVAESKATLPTEPLVFAKFPSSIVGPGEAITWDPGLTDGVDFEAELGVVIGRPARRVPAERALEHVFAYTCLNDVSARDLQFRDGQWVRGKSLDSFCPIGPWLVTADEIPAPQALAISCDVSRERLQSASTGDMIFGVAELIARLSHSFTLEAGDLVATGTPPGVGWFREPRRVLKDGDDVVVSIERVGRLSNPVRVQ
jgi:2-keto-4-pentenoate hydratase/2-oxohepta-3-ene-1,7-dioic acid hydratase in catechol pathway